MVITRLKQIWKVPLNVSYENLDLNNFKENRSIITYCHLF